MRLIIFIFLLTLLPTATILGSESEQVYVNTEKEKAKNDSVSIKEIKNSKINHRFKRLKHKINRFKKSKLFRKLKPKDDAKFWLWLISGLLTIISGLIALGSSAWLIFGIVIGLILYFGFISYLVFRYIDNGFKLEWFWWLILTALVGGGITGLIFLLGVNPVSSAIIGAILYGVLGLIAFILVIMMFIAVIKGIANFFKALFHIFG